MYSVRRLVYRAFINPDISDDLLIYPIDGDKFNVSPLNLTAVKNKGRKVDNTEGFGRPKALCDEDIEKIKIRLKNNATVTSIAREFNVCGHTIRKVKNNAY